MRIRCICVCFLTLFSCAAPTFAQGPTYSNQLDIQLDGPWIYQVDKKFDPGNHQPITVLIAMAPSVNGHSGPTFTTGDGYDLAKLPGVWCVEFDRTGCAHSTSTSTDLINDTHPGLNLLHVLPKASWNWYSYANDASRAGKSWYIILPIPDSASNDGVESFNFGATFGNYPNTAPQNIGTILHYHNGPTTINLYQCASPYSETCQSPQLKGPQSNTGTLRISFIAPDDIVPNNTPYCDFHIRDAYHSSMLFLDETRLDLGVGNINQSKGYVDLPPGGYAPALCYSCDPQNPNILPSCTSSQMTTSPNTFDATRQLAEIVDKLGPLHGSPGLQYVGLQSISKQLNGGVPRRSQLLEIQRLLHLSMQGLENLYLQNFELHAKAKTSEEIAQQSDRVLNLKTREDDLNLYIFRAASGGKDCRAAQMQLPNDQ